MTRTEKLNRQYERALESLQRTRMTGTNAQVRRVEGRLNAIRNEYAATAALEAIEGQIIREFAQQAAMLPDDLLRLGLSAIEQDLRAARALEQESAIWHFEHKLAAYRYEASRGGGQR